MEWLCPSPVRRRASLEGGSACCGPHSDGRWVRMVNGSFPSPPTLQAGLGTRAGTVVAQERRGEASPWAALSPVALRDAMRVHVDLQRLRQRANRCLTRTQFAGRIGDPLPFRYPGAV